MLLHRFREHVKGLAPSCGNLLIIVFAEQPFQRMQKGCPHKAVMPRFHAIALLVTAAERTDAWDNGLSTLLGHGEEVLGPGFDPYEFRKHLGELGVLLVHVAFEERA